MQEEKKKALNPFSAVAKQEELINETLHNKEDDMVKWNPNIPEYVALLAESGAAQVAKIGRAAKARQHLYCIMSWLSYLFEYDLDGESWAQGPWRGMQN